MQQALLTAVHPWHTVVHAERKLTDLDGIEGHANARKLDADVVRPAVLHQGDGSTACGGQLPECRVLQDLQPPK